MPYEGLIKITSNGPRWSGKVTFVQKHLMDPLRWTKPRRIFTDSMSDLFYDGVSDEMRDQIVAVMMISCLHPTKGGHIFQTLTKRAHEMRRYFMDPNTRDRVAQAAGRLMSDDQWRDKIAQRPEGLVHPKLWWGTSVENQAAADERIAPLIGTPAAVRFLSVEPLLGPIILQGDDPPPAMRSRSYLRGILGDARINWIIVGCESGPKARACETSWIRSLRDQCAATNTAFFLKQARPDKSPSNEFAVSIQTGANSTMKGGDVIELPYLDGVQHAVFPETA